MSTKYRFALIAASVALTLWAAADTAMLVYLVMGGRA
jgi:hypothetical protein